jgi:hypothetical protein
VSLSNFYKTNFLFFFKKLANQIYNSWAYRNNVNLFSAGTNFAPAVSTGTGFFIGRHGNVFSVFTQEPLRNFYAMKIPKDPSLISSVEILPEPVENSFRNLRFGRDFINTFETELIDLTAEGIIAKEFCHNEHCCDFLIDFDVVESNSTYQYRFVAFNGYRTYSGWGEKKLVICAIMICNDETLNSCGRMPDYDLDQVTFNSIEISTTFNRFGVLMMPNSLDLNMNSLNIDEFSYHEMILDENSRTSTIKLLQTHSDVQAFALYGHDFEIEDEFDFAEGSADGEGSGDDSLHEINTFSFQEVNKEN